MKLTDIVNQTRRRSNEVTNILRHPTSMLRMYGRRYFLNWYSNLEFGKRKKTADNDRRTNPSANQSTNSTASNLWQYLPLQKRRRLSKLPKDAAESLAKAPAETLAETSGDLGAIATAPALTLTKSVSGLYSRVPPALKAGEILKGAWWGRYTVDECLQDTPRFRRYNGFQNNGNHPVWIYEYQLLDSDFNQQDADQRSNAFRAIIDLNLRLGNERDFRIVKLQDVVASVDRRCFLITQALPNAQPLADYVAQVGVLSPQQVRRLLHQGLQTLQYLHSSYQVRWPDNAIEYGLYHGNLSLESLWIRHSEQTLGIEEPQFFIYFANFALWEHLFIPPSQYRHPHIAQGIVELGSITQDLAALGQIGFQLLHGNLLNPLTQRPYAPNDRDDWPEFLQNHPLQSFIKRLMGLAIEAPFHSAGAALSALQRLPKQTVESLPQSDFNSEENTELAGWHRNRWLTIFTIVLLGGLLGFIGVRTRFLLTTFRVLSHGLSSTTDIKCAAPCRLREMTDLPTGRIPYGLQTDSAWQTAFEQAEVWRETSVRHLSVEDVTQPPPTWETTLEARVAKAGESSLSLDLALESLDSRVLYQAMVNGKIDFALMRVEDNATEDDVPAGFVAEVVAYDGLVAVVPYSDAARDNNIAQRLNGQISLETLRDIYIGQLLAVDDQPVEAYFPLKPVVNREQETVQFADAQVVISSFETQLLTDAPTDQIRFQRSAFQANKAASIRELGQTITVDLRNSKHALRYDMFARMYRDFEQSLADNSDTAPIRIGFEQLSQVFGQCSVYPLAITYNQKTVQPFLQSGDRPLTPNTNLCNDKGSYWPNVEAFQTGDYPMLSSLAVVYPQGSPTGKVMAQMLKTAEGQYLISESGLVPLLPIPTLKAILWSSLHE